MRVVYKILFLLIIIYLPESTFSQNFNGIRTSNFDGVQNIILNPAGSVDNKTYLDINILTSQLYLRNNFFFIPNEDFSPSTYFFNAPEIPIYDSTLFVTYKYFLTKYQRMLFINPNFSFWSSFKYYTRVKQPLIYGQSSTMGPSFNLSLKKHSFAFFTNLKSATYADVPGIMLRAAIEGHENVIVPDETHLLGEINSGILLWSELGVGYATILNPKRNNNWYAGANLKLLSGYFGTYLNKAESYYSIRKKPFLTLHNTDINFGATHSMQYNKPSGYGLGMDLGIHYIKRGNSRPTEYYSDISKQSYGDYKYKLGFSVIDIGRIRFTQLSTAFSLQSDSLILIDGLEKYENIPIDSLQDYLLRDLQNEIYEIIPTANVDNKFKYSIPTKVSFQFDYHIKGNWYVNSIILAGIRTKNSHIKTAAQLSICPRYESKDFELWLPYTYNTIYQSQFGIVLRYKFVTIGTENIIRHFEIRDFTGTDFFVSLNLPLAREKFRK